MANGANHDANDRLRVAYGGSNGDFGPAVLLGVVRDVWLLEAGGLFWPINKVGLIRAWFYR